MLSQRSATPILIVAATASIRAYASCSPMISSPASTCRPNFFLLDGIDQAVRRLHVSSPARRARHLHRPLLSVRAAAPDLDHRDRPADFARAGLDQLDDSLGAVRREFVCLRAAGSSPHHQPPLWRNFPTIRASVGSMTTSCCSATPRRPRISRSAPAPSSHGGRHRAPEAFRETGGPMVRAATRRFETRRRDEVRRPSTRRRLAGLVRARQPLLEHGPDALRLRLMTRSKAHHLRQSRRCARRVRAAGRRGGGARDQALGFPVDTRSRMPMSSRFRLRGLTLENRVVVSRCASTRHQDGMPPTGTSCITARAPSAAPA